MKVNPLLFGTKKPLHLRHSGLFVSINGLKRTIADPYNQLYCSIYKRVKTQRSLALKNARLKLLSIYKRVKTRSPDQSFTLFIPNARIIQTGNGLLGFLFLKSKYHPIFFKIGILCVSTNSINVPSGSSM